MLGKIIEFIAVYALTSDRFYNSGNSSNKNNSKNTSIEDDSDEDKWVPCYMKPLNYDDDDDDE